MELIKELPEVFEEFAEQRQKSFLAMKGLKDQGVPVVGAYCTYFPAEIARAMGAVTVGLCSVSDETIPDAEKDLPKNLCPLIKSSYGFAKTDKCPFFYFSDVVVGETTCDGKKKMYEYMSDFKDVFVMELPNTQSEMALKLWKSELIRFKEYLEKKFDVEITDEAVLEAVKEENKVRKVMKDLYHVMALDPAPIKGGDLFKVLYGSGFKFDRKAIPAEIEAMREKIEKEYEEGKRLDKMPRILITGCPIGGATEKVIRAVEDNGGVVVAFENCNGAKSFDKLVDEENPDVYDALARRYLNIGCSVMTPNPNRLDLLDRLIDEFKLKQDNIAERVSKSRTAVTNSLRLLKLDERVQQMLIDEMISAGHARAILAITDKDKQTSVAMKVFDEKLSVRETEKLVKHIVEPPKKTQKTVNTAEDAIYESLEEKMKGIMGTRVFIHRKKNNKGKIEIEYYSRDELERIIELFESIR